jgi:hypothetical protein
MPCDRRRFKESVNSATLLGSAVTHREAPGLDHCSTRQPNNEVAEMRSLSAPWHKRRPGQFHDLVCIEPARETPIQGRHQALVEAVRLQVHPCGVPEERPSVGSCIGHSHRRSSARLRTSIGWAYASWRAEHMRNTVNGLQEDAFA